MMKNLLIIMLASFPLIALGQKSYPVKLKCSSEVILGEIRFQADILPIEHFDRGSGNYSGYLEGEAKITFRTLRDNPAMTANFIPLEDSKFEYRSKSKLVSLEFSVNYEKPGGVSQSVEVNLHKFGKPFDIDIYLFEKTMHPVSHRFTCYLTGDPEAFAMP